jgi:hypothetical protein
MAPEWDRKMRIIFTNKTKEKIPSLIKIKIIL